MSDNLIGWHLKYSDAEIAEILDAVERQGVNVTAHGWRQVTGIINFLQDYRNKFKDDYYSLIDHNGELEERIDHVTTDRNNLELRLEELELALSLIKEEKRELEDLLAEAEDNVLWLSKDVNIAEEELRLARKEICHMACSEDLYSYKGMTPVEVAYYMGWDCFKESDQ